MMAKNQKATDGQWHHYVIRVDNNEWELYVDGAFSTSVSALQTYDSSIIIGLTLLISISLIITLTKRKFFVK